MTIATFIDAKEVAQLLGLPDAAAFMRRRIYLEDFNGFPLPVPHWKRPVKYRADQVQHWLDGQGLPRAPETDIDPALISSGKVHVLGAQSRMMAEARRP
jgi:hypothetical protein